MIIRTNHWPTSACAVALAVLTFLAPTRAAEDSPVSFPALEHYEKLWKESLFTTRELPPVDAVAGPSFTDQLSLTGLYEVDGAVVAVIVDRSTSQILEARIGSDNEAGMRVRKVNPGATIEKTRVQLQKGDQAGWITFAETPALPTEPVAPTAVLPTRAMPRKGVAPAPAAAAVPAAPLPPNPLLPALPVSAPNDVPLPPP